jgi:hypothetical protein
MTDDDDDLDGLLFDEPDEESAAAERTNLLVVGARPPSAEMLNALEGQYRQRGIAPIVFIETDDVTGADVVGDAVTWAKRIGLNVLPTEAQCDQWAAGQRWASWEW